MNVTDLDSMRSHLVMDTADGSVRVVPVSLIEDWIEGRRRIEDADDWQLLVRAICADWLAGLPPADD